MKVNYTEGICLPYRLDLLQDSNCINNDKGFRSRCC